MTDLNSDGPITKSPSEDELVNVLRRLELLEQTCKDGNDSDYKKRQIRINIGLAVLTGCLVITSLWAICISIAATNAAKKSADVSAAALKKSIEFFHTDERAWVEIEPIKQILAAKAAGTIGASFDYQIYPKNVGKTVARDIVMRASCPSAGLSMGDDADQISRAQDMLKREYLGDYNRIPKVLAPNTVSAVPFRLHGQEPKEGGYYSFLIGRIDYVDAFSVKHWMTFCYIAINSRGELLNCKEGNDEDRNAASFTAELK